MTERSGEARKVWREAVRATLTALTGPPALLGDAAALIIDAALAAAREDERAKVEVWLRDDAARTQQELTRLHAHKKLTPSMTEEWEALISLKSGIADAIARHEHRLPR